MNSAPIAATLRSASPARSRAGMSAAIAITLAMPCLSHANPELDRYTERLANAIWHAEGGAKTKWPYGIRRKTADPRAACIASIRANLQRWHQAGKPGCFVEFMGRRYCPPSAHPLNRFWVRNVKARL